MERLALGEDRATVETDPSAPRDSRRMRGAGRKLRPLLLHPGGSKCDKLAPAPGRGRGVGVTNLTTPSTSCPYSRTSWRPATTDAGQDKPAEKTNNRLTERQYQTVLSVAAGKGITEPELKTRVLEAYGLPLDRLDRRQASELITRLSGRNGGVS